MKSWNKNRTIIAVLLLLIFLFSLILFWDLRRRKDIGDRKIIGTIIYKQKTIQRKFDGDVVWEKITKDTPVTNRDSIRTDDDSVVEIRLNDKTEISMDENSMIVLDFSNDKIDLDFLYGSLKANNEIAENSKLNIKSGDKSIELGDGNATITKTSDKDLNLNVEKGTALVKTKNGERKLGQDEQAFISESKLDVTKQTIKLFSPKDKSILISTAELQTVSFLIQTKSKEDSILEISNEPSFKKILKSANMESAKNISISLKPLMYFYRVKIPKEKLISNISKFTIIKDEKLKFSSPENSQKFYYTEKNPLISFSWRESENEKAYQLEIAKDKNFSDIVYKQDILKNRISLDLFSEGNYFAKLTSIPVTSYIEPQKSEILSFSVIKNKELEKIKFLTENKTKTTKLALEKKSFLVSWKQNPEYKNYEVEISDKSDFSNSKKSLTNINFFTPAFNSLGEYFVKVRGITGSKEYSEFSSLQFTVKEDTKINFISPKNGEEFYLNDNSEILFKWTKADFLSNSNLEISTDPEFKTIYKKMSSTQNFVSIKDFIPGNFHSRVKLISSDESNSEIIRTETISFKVLKILKPVNLIKPKNLEIIDLTNENSLRFDWEKMECKNYIFELFQKTDSGEKLIFKETTKDNYLEIKDLKILDEGKFQWQVKAKLEQNGKEFFTPSSNNFFSISLKETNDVPTPINPTKQHIQRKK